ncbi:hypothetical protein MTR_8g040530 [Medicago truncatula]|uniref:Uncharacterized protein n=1 Tax=Medicago truncatula TaxID=3880 RepID=G7LHK9_MEDTR|nr:hypothetical protein MTR_8g040530 [Medicago truncatula]
MFSFVLYVIRSDCISSQVLSITNPCIANELSHKAFIPPNSHVIANHLYFKDWLKLQEADDDVPHEVDVVRRYEYDQSRSYESEGSIAYLGGGWARILFMPIRRGRQVTINVCRSIKRDVSKGEFCSYGYNKEQESCIASSSQESHYLG